MIHSSMEGHSSFPLHISILPSHCCLFFFAYKMSDTENLFDNDSLRSYGLGQECG